MKYICCATCAHAGSARCMDCAGEKFVDRGIPGSVYITQARRNGKSQYMADMIQGYITNDVEATKNIYRNMVMSHYGANPGCVPQIKDVIFNNPATIVFWADGTKTVVKCQDEDIYDPEKGLAMAISKKALGNQGNYCNELKKWLGRYEEAVSPIRTIFQHEFKTLKDMRKSFTEFLDHLAATEED